MEEGLQFPKRKRLCEFCHLYPLEDYLSLKFVAILGFQNLDHNQKFMPELFYYQFLSLVHWIVPIS